MHLELHTADLARARAFYATLCGWRGEPIDTVDGSYLALELGKNLGGGIVECGTQHAIWLPYVEVAQIDTATHLARQLGASLLLEPREGPAGWTWASNSRIDSRLPMPVTSIARASSSRSSPPCNTSLAGSARC